MIRSNTVLYCSLVLLSVTNLVSSFAFPSLKSSRYGVTSRRPHESVQLEMSGTSSDLPSIRLGIFGGGTVGGGIIEILKSKNDHFSELTNCKIEVRKLCVRDASKERDFSIPEGCTVVTNYDDIINDEDIDVVVEVMGGTTDAKDVVYNSIKAGKDVVTANKALIAAYLPEIEALLKEVNDAKSAKKVEFRYEAAVCGGIPIIRSMQSDFVGDDITMISGIINGCTNFMLTAMDTKEQSYDDALAEASKLGYAEADPTLDVGGFDARSKLKILMSLAFGIDVSEDEISCKGITDLTKTDFEYAKRLGGTIKLMGVAKKIEGTNNIAAFVSPTYVKSDETLAAVSGATNAIEVISHNLQSTTYIGQGAGRFPTANSCINDIISLAKGDQTPLPFNAKNNKVQFVNDYQSLFYIRIMYKDMIGITKQIGDICERNNVSIHSLLQNPISSRQDSAFAIITDKASLSSIRKVCAELDCVDWCRGGTLFMPVLHDSWEI